jgi:hypothetical protein
LQYIVYQLYVKASGRLVIELTTNNMIKTVNILLKKVISTLPMVKTANKILRVVPFLNLIMWNNFFAPLMKSRAYKAQDAATYSKRKHNKPKQ